MTWTKRALAGLMAGAVALSLAAGANAETTEEPIVDDTAVSETAPTTPEVETLEFAETTVTTDASDVAEPAAEEPGTDVIVEDENYIPNESIPLEQVLAEMPLNLNSAAIPAGAKPVYRFHSPWYNGHHYTISENEKNEISRKFGDAWRFEQIAFYAFENQASGTIPVYRFWSSMYNSHFYTTSKTEADDMGRKWPGVWKPEGIAFYVYPEDSNAAGAAGVHRFWSQQYGRHFFTASNNEKNAVVNQWGNVWSLEGTRFKVIPAAEKTVQERIVEKAVQYLGYPYAFAGSTPATGFDCSGYIKWVVQQATGKTLYHGATQQARAMTRIPASQAVPGDFWFRGSPSSYGHVGVYMGNNRIAHSPDYGRLTSIQTIWTTGDFYRFNG